MHDRASGRNRDCRSLTGKAGARLPDDVAWPQGSCVTGIREGPCKTA